MTPPDTPESRVEGAVRPESECRRCGGWNPIWAAPSPLWNRVMRSDRSDTLEPLGGIVCPTCFSRLAENAGVGGDVIEGRSGPVMLWRFMPAPDEVTVPLVETREGDNGPQRWDPEQFFWVDALTAQHSGGEK